MDEKINLKGLWDKIYSFYSKFGPKQTIENFENDVLFFRDSELSYKFARYIKGADIRAHENIVLENKELEWCYYFAKDVKGAKVKLHGQVILESNNLYFCFLFAKDIKGVNIKPFLQLILDSGDYNWCYQFMRYVKLNDIKSIEQLVKVILSCDDEVLKQKFLQEVATSGSDELKMLVFRIIEIFNIKQMIKSIDNSNNKKLL